MKKNIMEDKVQQDYSSANSVKVNIIVGALMVLTFLLVMAKVIIPVYYLCKG